MVLDIEKIKQINNLVYERPRNIDEISKALGVNWRTADRYVDEIAAKTGAIRVHTFREGTRGALKVAYWNNIEKVFSSDLQKKLLDNIIRGISKADFSPFEIYQYVEPGKRNAFWEEKTESQFAFYGPQNVNDLLSKAKTEFYSFSGNMSWVDLNEDGTPVVETVERLAKKGCKIKIVSRIDLPSLPFVERLLSINERMGTEMIEIRHAYQPLRGAIIDNDTCRLVELVYPNSAGPKTEKEKAIYYEIYDAEWIDWLKKVFYKIWSSAIPATKRIEDLNSIQKMRPI